jgi:hypothetical protein
LESKSIDDILGMDWLSKHKVLIDCAEKSLKLTTPNGKELEFVAEPVATAKGVANCAKVNKLDASQGSEVQWLVSFLMSSLRSCQVYQQTVASSL